jgi:hypothetical protein
MEFLNKYGAKILTALAALVAVVLLFFVFLELKGLVALRQDALPLVAIGGVVVLVLLLTAVTTMFSILDLTNKDQAMGLPEGSIRAVIALSLIVLFAILSVFLYDSISRGGSVATIADMPAADRAQFIRENPLNAREIQSVASKTTPGTFDVTYRTANAASEDFAKQLLVLLGTLMTAVASFYLGAGTVTSAVKTGSEAANQTSAAAPTFTSVRPQTHSITTDGANLHLDIDGTNLEGFSRVRLIKAGETPIEGTAVNPGATKLSCDFNVGTAPVGTWRIEVAEGARPAKVAGDLKVEINP